MWAAQHDVEVTNNSYFADPWLFNCRNDAEQRAIWEAERRAVKFAQQSGTVVVAAEGNQADDLAHPTQDATSPDDTTPVTPRHHQRLLGGADRSARRHRCHRQRDLRVQVLLLQLRPWLRRRHRARRRLDPSSSPPRHRTAESSRPGRPRCSPRRVCPPADWSMPPAPPTATSKGRRWPHHTPPASSRSS